MLNMVNVSATYEDQYDAFGAGISSFFSYKLDEKHSIQLGAFANYLLYQNSSASCRRLLLSCMRARWITNGFGFS